MDRGRFLSIVGGKELARRRNRQENCQKQSEPNATVHMETPERRSLAMDAEMGTRSGGTEERGPQFLHPPPDSKPLPPPMLSLVRARFSRTDSEATLNLGWD